jgi:1,4-alpha-glucan branching enzyme
LERMELKRKLQHLRPNVVFLQKTTNTRPLLQRIREVLKSTPEEKGVKTNFRLKGYAEARVVALTSSFNNWNRSHTLLTKEGDDWVCQVNLKPGVYFYKFVVDGRWITDPANPNTEYDTNGNLNSIKDVKAE